jgi:cyclopropane fatty-acyl-phospholipid synthase-like methyltransferase
MIEKIIKVLGKERSAKYFKAIYDTLPKKTVTYLGAIVKVFELFLNR